MFFKKNFFIPKLFFLQGLWVQNTWNSMRKKMGCQIQMFIQTSQTYSKIYRTYLLWQKENVTSTVLSSSKCQNSYGGRVTYFIFSTYVPILITSSKCLCMTLYNIRSFGKSFGKVALRERERESNVVLLYGKKSQNINLFFKLQKYKYIT